MYSLMPADFISMSHCSANETCPCLKIVIVFDCEGLLIGSQFNGVKAKTNIAARTGCNEIHVGCVFQPCAPRPVPMEVLVCAGTSVCVLLAGREQAATQVHHL